MNKIKLKNSNFSEHFYSSRCTQRGSMSKPLIQKALDQEFLRLSFISDQMFLQGLVSSSLKKYNKLFTNWCLFFGVL